MADDTYKWQASSPVILLCSCNEKKIKVAELEFIKNSKRDFFFFLTCSYPEKNSGSFSKIKLYM